MCSSVNVNHSIYRVRITLHITGRGERGNICLCLSCILVIDCDLEPNPGNTNDIAQIKLFEFKGALKRK